MFNRYGASCDIYKSALFRLYCRDSVSCIQYENGSVDTLGVIDTTAMIGVVKTKDAFTVHLNSEQVTSIPSSEFTIYFPSMVTEVVDRSFRIGSAEMCENVWRGRMDEFLFYHRALSVDEIKKVRQYLVSEFSEGLADISHSEWAYAPPFSPSITDYKAVVPADVTSIEVDVAKSGKTVKVSIEGETPPADIGLTGTRDTVAIDIKTDMGDVSYSLKTEKSIDYVVYVDSAATGARTGTSWHDAYTDLQDALDDAAKNGKEIWVAKGTYRPSKKTDTDDARSATFLLVPGTELIGGFKGNESKRDPNGSPYKTILSGDLSANDDKASSWPPKSDDMEYLEDNAYHVVTIGGNKSTRSIKVEGFTIERGAADGKDTRAIGGGVYSPVKLPKLRECIVQKNYAMSSGAGIYARIAPDSIKNCLVRENVSFKGDGAGMYMAGGDSVTIDASVFHENVSVDTNAVSDGGGLYVKKSKVSIVNSIFYKNQAQSSGGALFLTESKTRIVNCTVVMNHADKNGGGIMADTLSNVGIYNTILWANTSESDTQLSGNYSAISHSCIEGGHKDGVETIDKNPRFIDINDPYGEDGTYGDLNDGLSISNSNSPCENIGLDTVFTPEFDILEISKKTGGAPDIGAYEAYNLNTSGSAFGQVNVETGEFTPVSVLNTFGIMVFPAMEKSNCWYATLALKC